MKHSCIRRFTSNLRQGLLRALNLAVFKRRPDYHYVPRFYGASAEKHLDIRQLPIFGPLARDALNGGRTMLYYDRLYTLYQALLNAKRLRLTSAPHVVEMGVYRGGGSAFLASVMNAVDINGILHSFDTFEGHPHEDTRPGLDAGHATSTTLFKDTSFASVQAYLSKYPFLTVYKGRFQDRCTVLDDVQVVLAHLDVDIYEPTIFALRFLSKRLVIGGALVVDDYGFDTCPGLKQAVDEFVASTTDYFVLHQLTGQCILVRIR